MYLYAILLIPFFLCWGSFLNVLAYRLVHEGSIIKPRSHCPHCKHTLAWYDLIPLLSFIFLRGKCRYCYKSISYLYFLIELITAVVMPMLFINVDLKYFPAYFIFFSALIVTIRTDLDQMLISRFVTLFLIPLALIMSAVHVLPITLLQSIAGALFGYLTLYIIATIFFWITKKNGLGQGDLDLLAFIGSFTGIYGAWTSLMLGSIIGSIAGGLFILIAKPQGESKIPFGPFLALGAMCYVLFEKELLHTLFHISINA